MSLPYDTSNDVCQNDDVPGLTAQLVAQAFCLGNATSDLVPIEGSFSHKVFRLTSDEGHFAVKCYNRFWDSPHWLPRLEGAWRIERRAFENGVSMPEPVLLPGSEWPWLELDVGSPQPATVRVHRWVEGRRVPPTPAPISLAVQVGSALAALHELGRGAGPWVVLPFPPPPVEEWEPMDAEWRAKLRSVEPVLAAAAELILAAAVEKVPLVWSHRDVAPKNVLVTAGGRLVITDWDVAWRERPDQEVAHAAFDFAGVQADQSDRSVVEAVVRAYKDSGRDIEFGPTSFAGWAKGEIEWLAFNIGRSLGHQVQSPRDRDLARREADRVLHSLPRLFDQLDEWVRWLQST